MRASLTEIMDLGPSHYSIEEYEECLDQLHLIGRYLGGDKATFKAFRTLGRVPTSIVDVGCGGGAFTKRLGKEFPKASVVGMDISKEAIRYAQKDPLQNVEFIEALKPEEKVDVITSTLVCHHMRDEELVQFLKESYESSNQAVIINDLHRHFIAIACFYAVSRIFFRNRLVKHDGIVSIKRSFKRKDWIRLLQQAKIPLEKCSLTWHLPFRWILVIRK